MRLRFYYDVVCPYAYLASERVEAVAARTGAELEWCPVLLGGLYQHHGTDQVPAESWAEAKVGIGARDLAQQAAHHGLAFTLNPRHPQRTVAAMRLIVAAPWTVRASLSHDLFRAYHVDGQDLSDHDVLARIAGPHGVDMGAIEDASIKQTLRGLTAAAAKAGTFGVPVFEVGRRRWWGQDRLHLVEQALGGPGRAEPAAAPHKARRLTFFHDFSSPFSYLASTQIDRIAAATGARVRWRPILLGALFREIGTPDVPLFSMTEAKRSFVGQDLQDWAQWWGEPFRFPDTFPLRTVTALRIALQDPTTTRHLYRAAWVDGKDIGAADVLAQVLTNAGFDADGLLAGTQEQAIKQALKDNTTAAIDAGACGVPTFVLGKQLWWGQDRMNLVTAALQA